MRAGGYLWFAACALIGGESATSGRSNRFENRRGWRAQALLPYIRRWPGRDGSRYR